METLGVIGLIVILAIFAFVVLGLKYHLIWKGHKRCYTRIQAGRASLSDEAFCNRVGLAPSVIGVVAVIRSKLAEQGRYGPLRIYPEDAFSLHFGLHYDDDVAMLVQEMKLINGYKGYSFPLEEVSSVADFIRVVLKLREPSIQG